MEPRVEVVEAVEVVNLTESGFEELLVVSLLQTRHLDIAEAKWCVVGRELTRTPVLLVIWTRARKVTINTEQGTTKGLRLSSRRVNLTAPIEHGSVECVDRFKGEGLTGRPKLLLVCRSHVGNAMKHVLDVVERLFSDRIVPLKVIRVKVCLGNLSLWNKSI